MKPKIPVKRVSALKSAPLADPQQLTSRQRQILDWIRAYLETTGMPPTRAEIATGLGFSTPSSAEDHLQALARKGAIEMLPGASRGLRLKDIPGIPVQGTLPLVVHRTSEARNGQIVVARIGAASGDEVTVKRFRRRGRDVVLSPENSAFEPIVVDPRVTAFVIEGIGVGLVRSGSW
jgi:repressor LexA